MLRTALIALRAHPWRTGALFVFVALAGLMLHPSHGQADATPFPIQGDDANNTISISVTIDDQVKFCVDDFCADQPIEEVQTIDIDGLGGNDTVIIDETNGLFPDININVDGGPGTNVLEICPGDGFCADSEIESSTWTPGPDVNAGLIQQTSPEGTTAINAVNTQSVIDGAPGELTGNGTPADDAITYASGPLTDSTQAYGLITVNDLTPYQFTNKSSLDINSGSGVDTLQDDRAGTPTGMTGTCDGTNAVCLVGGGSPDDSLVVDGVPGAADQAVVAPADGAGSIDGIADSPRIGYEGVSAIKLALQYGADGDTVRLDGTPGDDLVRIDSSTSPGDATITGTYDQAGATPFQLPAITVEGGTPGTAGALTVDAGDGTDALTYDGTDQGDVIAAEHRGDAEVFSHTAGSTLVENVTLTGFESADLEGLAGDDTLRDGDSADGSVTPLDVATSWNGGTGTDTLAYSAASSAGVVTMGNGVVQQPTSAAASTTSVENIDVDAAGNGLTAVGTPGSDTVSFAPTGADSGQLFSSSDPAAYHVSAVGGLFTIDPVAGTDEVDVDGTAAADDIPLTRDPSGTLTVQVGSLLPVRISAAAEATQVYGLGSGDRFLVGGTGGPASLTLNGGPDAGSDRILLAGDIPDATVTGAATSATGQVTAAGPPIAFAGIAHVSAQGDGAGTLTVSAAPNVTALTQTGASVQLSDGITVDYAGYPTLALGGGTDTDHITVEPASAAVAQLDVDGGPNGSTRGTLDVLGTALSDTAKYRPTGPAAGEVDLSGDSPVTFASIGSVVLNGRTDAPSGDALLIDTSQIHGTQVLDPGVNFDGGTIHFRDGAGTTNTGAPLVFGQLGVGSVSFTDTSRVDDLIYDGTSASDTFSVDRAGKVSLNAQIPVSTPGVATLELHGSSGADTFALPPAHPFPGTAGGPGIITDGGTAATGDRVELDASAVDVSVDYASHTLTAGASAPVAVPAVQYVDVDGATALSVLGTSDPDVLRYTPTGPQGGAFTRDNGSLEVHFTDVAGAVRVDGRDGADTVAVNATSAPDSISIARGDPTAVQVGALKALELPAATEALQVTGGAGGDTFTVTGSGGPAALNLDGGGPAGAGDRLDFVGSSGTVVAGVVPYNGNVHAPTGDVGYVNLDVVAMRGDSTGSLSVVGTSGNDAVSVGGAAVPAVQVNAGTEIRYDGYPAISVDGGGGADEIDMSYEHIGDVRSLTLTGGNQLGDHLAVLDRPGATDTVRVTPTGPNAGTLTVDGITPAIDFGGVASVALDGNGGGDRVVVVSAPGDNNVQVTPGATADSATVRIDSFVPFSFQNLGTGGGLQLVDADGSRADTLTYAGTSGDDTFAVAGAAGTLAVDGQLPVAADGVADLVLHGQDGDDTFNLVGPLPFTTTTVDGGAAGPVGDTVNISGAASDVSVDLGQGQVTGYGGTIRYPGMETVNTDASTHSLTELGSSGDDTLCYDPMTLTDGRAYLMGVSGSGNTSTVCDPTQRGASVLNNFTSVGQLFLDPGAGVDQVIVDGTAGDDLVTLLATTPWVTVNVHPQPTDPNTTRLTASVANASTENLAIHGLDGQDDIDVHPFDNSAPTLYIDGGSPLNKAAGNVADQMEVHDGGGVAHLHTYKSHVFGTGEVTATFRDGFEQDFNYFDVDSLKTIQNSK